MAWGTLVESATLTTDANFEAFNDGTNAIEIFLNPRERLSITVSIASEVGEVDDLEVQVLGGHRITSGNGLDAVTSSTVLDLNTTADAEADDYYMGMYFLMTTGGETADVREIVDFTSAADTVTLIRALSGTPTAAETYNIYHMRALSNFVVIAETTLTEERPQNDGIVVTGVPYVLVRARSTGATDAHIALLSYRLDGVSA